MTVRKLSLTRAQVYRAAAAIPKARGMRAAFLALMLPQQIKTRLRGVMKTAGDAGQARVVEISEYLEYRAAHPRGMSLAAWDAARDASRTRKQLKGARTKAAAANRKLRADREAQIAKAWRELDRKGIPMHSHDSMIAKKLGISRPVVAKVTYNLKRKALKSGASQILTMTQESRKA